MATVTELSEVARDLVRLHLSGRTLHMKGPDPEALPGRTVEETRNGYRELVAVGLMDPISGFAHGPESHFRLTDAGWERRGEFSVDANGAE